MEFKYAREGINVFFAAGILDLITSVCSTALLLYLYLSSPTSATEEVLSTTEVSFASGLILFGTSIAISVLDFVVSVLQMIGSSKAAKDENTFKVVLYMIIVGMVVTVIGAVFSENSKVVGSTSLISNFINMFIGIYILQGIIQLAGKLNNSSVEVMGERLYKTMISIYGFIILTQLFSMVFNGTGVRLAAGMFTIFAGALSVVQYVLYLIYLGKARQMLA